MKKTLLSALLSALTFALLAQGEANNWVFGNYAGVSWNTGVPVAFSGSAMNTTEGVACISDNAGNLLFYTDGGTVWNRLHQVMSNGTGLMGSFTSTQSAIIVPWPGDTSRYFIFTIDAVAGSNGVRYSVVNMTLQGGLGAVEVPGKNTLLYTPSCEKLTAVRHANGTDVWVVTHQWGNNSFSTYRVTATGVDTTPVVSSAGASHTTAGHWVGYMKTSPDGTKLALVVDNGGFAEFFNFDNNTGQVLNSLFYKTYPGMYGLEFSPNSRYVYISPELPSGDIVQYDIQAGSSASILASENIVGVGFYPSLQLAVDGKIYVSNNTKTWLGVINNPDSPGAASGYVSVAVILTSGASCRLGMPDFVTSYLGPQAFTFQNMCIGEATSFTISALPVDSANWNFGDVASGAANTSALLNPSHMFSSGGTFPVTLITWKSGLSDTSQRDVVIQPLPVVNLGNDTTLCTGQSFQLNATTANSVYLWQNNSTAPTQTVTQSGTYWVEINVAGCSTADTIQVNFATGAGVTLGADTSFCPPGTLVLNVTSPGATYHWQDNTTLPVYTVSQAGTYSVTVLTSTGCIVKDTVVVNVFQMPIVSITASQYVFCSSDSALVCSPAGFTAYQWNTGVTDICISAKQAGNYYVTVTDNNGCSAESNHLAITVYPLPPVSISVNGDTLTAYNAVTYQWYLNNNYINGATSHIYITDQAGSYSVAVTDTNGCMAISNPIFVSDISESAIANPQFVILPNPATNQLFIETNGIPVEEINIYNTSGSLANQTKQPQGQSIDISQLANGVYVAEIKTKEVVVRKRAVKM